ncbi:ABC transporter permease [Amycolatopsis sp. NPDC004747]
MLLDTWLVFGRAVRQLRSVFWIVFGLAQPVLYLGLFAPLLTPIVNTTPGLPAGSAWQIFVPALLVQMAMVGGLFVGFGLLAEYREGVIERMRVTPVSRTALLLGRVLCDSAVTLLQGGLMVGIAAVFGLRVPLGGAVAGLLLMTLLSAALSSASYAVAMAVKRENRFMPLLNSALLPLVLLSGILLPMQLAPGWLRFLSRVNPLSYVVDAERAVFLGDLTSGTAVLGSVIAVVLAVVAIVLGALTFRRRNE